VDFVTVDGGEGGTGAAPLVFADAVAYPFRVGFAEVYRRFKQADLADDVTFIGAGKLGLTENAIVAFALGVDMVNVAREAMFAVGCIQAQRCHTGTCPTGVATQSSWLAHGLDPRLKSVRVANYVVSLRRDLLKLAEAVDVDLLDGVRTATPLGELYGYAAGWGELRRDQAERIEEIMGGHLPDEEEPPTA
jgi:glutamate synthase domain-containing protein 2